MITLLIKFLLTALLVVAISELGKRSSFAGALLASLPLTSTPDAFSCATAFAARGIFWLVLPSLAFFLVFPAGVRAGWGFWTAICAGIVATLLAYGALLGIDRMLQLKLFA